MSEIVDLNEIENDIRQAQADGYHHQPGTEVLLQLVSVAKAVAPVLDGFHPFFSAWEANNPWTGGDGEELYANLKEAMLPFWEPSEK